ncbi:MAG: bifunctional (p)ppGpp synthetase/guanosine-3',5'-bis(diphosphate) 3'-pyrophosphohydrolase [Bacilli bacterium]|nr:bifunctional (p)ppGpp synthetase/guanosine-3',5'-bis(diphosphate) 3'-pyrophosphohydrolase [Bacilli bacterium]
MTKLVLDITFDRLLEKVKTYIKNEEELETIEKAYSFAAKMHFGIKRLTGEDYIDHPLHVAYILTDIKADAATLCAALMHDILEDTEVTKEEMSAMFGEEITNLVDGVTKINKLNFSGSNDAMNANHRKIIVGLSEDVRVIIIKLADRLHNMRTLWVHAPKKQKEKAKETLDILTPLAERLGMNQLKSELEDLSLRYYKPDVYFSVVEKLNKTKAERDKHVLDMIESVSEILDKNNIKHEIKGRSKSIFSIYKKLDKGKKFSEIYDLLALRVFVETDAECYSTLGIIHSKFRPIPKRFKDYVAMPKTNMYQSLHTTVFGVDEDLFEIQIRTYKMDEIAEHGIASHWSYKEKGSNVKADMQNEMEQKLQFFQSLMELQKEGETDEEFVNSVRNDILKKSVYVFTPLGNVIELPVGSTPIDFAYKVHSRVGDQMVGAIVNGAIVPLDYELQDNDIIKINTNNNSAGPSREWIALAKTNSAKNKIKSFFHKIDREENLKAGTEIFNKELKRQKIAYTEFFTNENIDKVLTELKMDSMDEVMMMIGGGKLNALSTIHLANKQTDTKAEILLKKAQSSEIKKPHVSHADVVVEGATDIKVNIAACCKPLPGDDIVGYITKGYGITVHRSNCPNVAELEERIISVHWSEETDQKYQASLMVRASSEEHLLLDIIAKTSGNDNMIQNITNLAKGRNFAYEITILVPNDEVLYKFIHDIESMPNVVDVERLIK